MTPQPAQNHEPSHHHRAKQLADAISAVFLDQEQGHQYHQRHWHYPVFQAAECQLQALYRRQHGNRRGDHAVAIEQRRPDQAQNHQHRTQARIGTGSPPGQRGQGHDAALALVVGPQDEQHVLDRDDPDQRPENQGQDAKHPVVIDLNPIMAGKHLLEGVERTGADIAIHHPDRRHQHPQRLAPGVLATRRLTTCLTHQ